MSRYSCNYKKLFFALFYDDFFPNIFCSHYWCVSGKIVSRVLFPPFFGHDIRVNIKNEFSHFSPTIFSPTYFSRTIRVFLEKLFLRVFSPQFFGHDIRVNIKNVSSQFLRRFFPNTFYSHYFALFCIDFFPTFFARSIGLFLEKLFRAFFPPF